MGTVIRVDAERPATQALEQASRVLLSGGVVVLPTDTVYGVCVAAGAAGGPDKVFKIKRRDRDKAIPWLVADADALTRYGTDVPAYAFRLADRFWPGALTLVVKASPEVGEAFRADDGTIALRAPDSVLVRDLATQVGSPLVTSSANTQASPAPASFDELEWRIIDEADLVIDGGAAHVGSASTVVICTGPKPTVARDSAIPAETIMEVAHGTL